TASSYYYYGCFIINIHALSNDFINSFTFSYVVRIENTYLFLSKVSFLSGKFFSGIGQKIRVNKIAIIATFAVSKRKKYLFHFFLSFFSVNMLTLPFLP